MPKLTIDFPDRLEFAVTHEMRVQLIALGFLSGRGSSYAGMARNLLAQAIQAAITKLDAERRKAYDEILEKVEISQKGRKR